MERVIAVSHHDPHYLKATYAQPFVDHVDHERHIKAGRKYITWDDGFRVWKMTPERVPIPLGRWPDLGAAMYRARL